MASIPIAALAGLLAPGFLSKFMSSDVRSETGNIHSLETTEMASQASDALTASDSKSTVNVAPIAKPVNVDNTSSAVNVNQLQAQATGTFMASMMDPTQIQNFVVSATATRGTVLYSTPVSPRMLIAQDTTRMSYLSRLFTYWRGDIVFNAIFTKSILIQTKMIMVFVPGAVTTDPPPTPSQATQYKHHVIMNPANEQTYALLVPFVSNTIFNLMEQSTGILYIILYDPIQSSFAPGSTPVTLPVNLLISSPNMDFREYEIVPTLDNDVVPFIPAEYSYALVAASNAGTVNILGGTGVITFLSDNGTSISCPIGVSNIAYPTTFTTRVPVWCENYVFIPTAVAYNPSVCATIYGNPQIGEQAQWARRVFCNTATGLLSVNVFSLFVYVTRNDSIFVASATPAANAMSQYVTLMSSTVFQLPLSYLTMLSEAQYNSINDRLAKLEVHDEITSDIVKDPRFFHPGKKMDSTHL